MKNKKYDSAVVDALRQMYLKEDRGSSLCQTKGKLVSGYTHRALLNEHVAVPLTENIEDRHGEALAYIVPLLDLLKSKNDPKYRSFDRDYQRSTRSFDRGYESGDNDTMQRVVDDIKQTVYGIYGNPGKQDVKLWMDDEDVDVREFFGRDVNAGWVWRQLQDFYRSEEDMMDSLDELEDLKAEMVLHVKRRHGMSDRDVENYIDNYKY